MASVGKNTEAAGQRTQNTTEQNTRVGTERRDRKRSCSTNTERRDLQGNSEYLGEGGAGLAEVLNAMWGV